MNRQEIVSFGYLVGILPVLREILALNVFKESYLDLWMRLQVLETD